MAQHPVAALFEAGQSVWLDFIRRDLLTSGELKRMVDDRLISGLTSNPTIFEKAIAGARDYDAQLTALARAGKNRHEIFDAIAIEDIQGACDTFRGIYDRTQGQDGFASIEVSPLLARSTAETVAEAKRLWRAVDRPNVMVKIPATAEGIPAIRAALGEGININITLIFSVSVYERVVEAFFAGLEDLVAKGGDPSRVASVASFFVSRVDTLLDPVLTEKATQGPPAERPAASALIGKVAVANARVAYGRFAALFQGPRWEALAAKGARVQRPLWASTGTKNKAYSDVKYITELVGKDTVNTVPPDTLAAFRDHGTVAESLTSHLDDAKKTLAALATVGVSLEEACAKLERDGVHTFSESFAELMERIEARRVGLIECAPARRRADLGALAPAVDARLAALDKDAFAKRLFARDTSLWSADKAVQATIASRLGWLDAPAAMELEIPALVAFTDLVAREGFTDAVVLGMGGSSLCPDLFARTFPPVKGRLRLHVLDSTDPLAVERLTRAIPPAKTLFLVSTKSGNTIETLSFAATFEAEVRAAGVANPGRNFVAITDPGSPLEALALAHGYRRTFLNAPDIGGRYSALSFFGLVPAALMGLDLARMLEAARGIARASGPRALVAENPGLWLGAVLGEAAKAGRDKLTLVVPAPLTALGAWLEQLIAESTGKQGTGIIPVADEPAGLPDVYGNDRVFVAVSTRGATDTAAFEVTLDALVRAGHPVVRYTLEDALDVGGEFMRWEIVTATASAILGVNAFDEPNVSESKANTAKALAAFEAEGHLAPAHALAQADGLSVYSGGTHGSMLRPAAAGEDGHDEGSGSRNAVERVLAAHLATVQAGDYVALLAYLDPTSGEAQRLSALRASLRDRFRVATTLGIGPRYLHSTGQLHKGGPAGGVFLVLTAETRADRVIPGAPYSYGVLIDAQAQGDVEALTARNRRVLRVHLEGPREEALGRLQDSLDRAWTPGLTTGAAHAGGAHGS